MQVDCECEKCINCWYECDLDGLLCASCTQTFNEIDNWMMMSVTNSGVHSCRDGDMELMFDIARKISKEKAFELHESGHDGIYARNDERWDWHLIDDPIIRHTESTVYYEYMTAEAQKEYKDSYLINLDDFDFAKCYEDILNEPSRSILTSVKNYFDDEIGYKHDNTRATSSIRTIMKRMMVEEERPEYIEKIKNLPYKVEDEDESDY